MRQLYTISTHPIASLYTIVKLYSYTKLCYDGNTSDISRIN